jgi:GntR family transcriptional repressor for pyruvate dehydrogenase complex
MLVNQIIKNIADGTLQPGDRLPSELEMTRRFKISRISLREAMKLLEAKGYIESFGKQGKFICSTADNHIKSPLLEIISKNHSNIKSLFQLKRMILAESAYIAAQRADSENIESMRGLLNEITNTNIAGTENYYKLIHLISKLTGNVVYSHVIMSIVEVLNALKESEGIALIDTEMKKLALSLGEVIDAISEKDGDRARQHMTTHFEELERLVS